MTTDERRLRKLEDLYAAVKSYCHRERSDERFSFGQTSS